MKKIWAILNINKFRKTLPMTYVTPDVSTTKAPKPKKGDNEMQRM
jgi:hypothetical protein